MFVYWLCQFDILFSIVLHVSRFGDCNCMPEPSENRPQSFEARPGGAGRMRSVRCGMEMGVGMDHNGFRYRTYGY